MIDQLEADRRHRRTQAIEVFDAGWIGAPDRALLVEATCWTVVAANPAARGELLARHGLDLVGMRVEDMMRQPVDLGATREKWSAFAAAEVMVQPHLYEPERSVRVAIWPLGGFDGDYLVVVVRDERGDVVELPESLTARERDIVALLLQGLRIPSIASQLHLSHHTVRNHLRTIFAKCNVTSQRELVELLRSRACARPPMTAEAAET